MHPVFVYHVQTSRPVHTIIKPSPRQTDAQTTFVHLGKPEIVVDFECTKKTRAYD